MKVTKVREVTTNELEEEGFNRLNDGFVKFLFVNPKREKLLIGLLNDVLADVPPGAERLPPIVDIEYLDRETTPSHQRDKMPRFDIIARTADGRLFHIEIQLESYGNLIPRVLNYVARDYVGLTERGEDYSSEQVICIVISDFTLFHDTESYHTLHRILNVESGAWDIRGMELHFIEMPKLRKSRKWPGTGLENLLYYLGSMGGEKEMQTLEAQDARVAEMRELERIFRSKPELVREYERREQDRRDYRYALKQSEARGISIGEARGRAEGEARTRRAIMENLIAGGMSPQQAAQFTGLSV